MGDSGIVVDIAAYRKARLPVKTNCMHLRGKHDLLATLPPTFGNRSLQQGLSHATPAPVQQHRHASEPAPGQQAGTTDGHIAIISCHEMLSGIVFAIPFQHLRHMLLLDKDTTAYIGESCVLRRPISKRDPDSGRLASRVG